MSLVLNSLSFGLVVAFIAFGLIGILIPMVPGTLLIWVAVLIYVLGYGMATVGMVPFAIITLIALVTGSADLWLPLLGAGTAGASKRALVFGIAGSLIGTLIAPLLGTVIGYAAGILLGEFQARRDWGEALRASFGGLAGWGIATAVQLGGGLLILLIFAWRVLFA